MNNINSWIPGASEERISVTAFETIFQIAPLLVYNKAASSLFSDIKII